ncbi:MAG: hypothetical protein OXC48_07320, partial [Endozoicomonadaceae bacterium]|nr:hypothetical protein [Endozoicomonadaceae bacterium]
TAPTVVQQNYKFTRLNRIASVTEKLIDTSSPTWHSLNKMMSYTYANPEVPLRLTSVSTQWNNQQPDTHAFVYDVTGNMTIDGQGNKLSYNPFNQITRVISAAGKVSLYNYDGQGKEVKIVTQKGTRQMLYQQGELSGEIVTDTANNIHRISYPSAEIKTTDNTITNWNESDYKGDVINILKQDKTLKQWTVQQHNIYSPYGMVWSYEKQKTAVPAFQQTLKGFDGEMTDAVTGWQFLGAGHRTYNPSQRYFFSEDPAGDGYAFGSNNPIMNSDPSGNMPKWLGKMIKISSLVLTLGMNNVRDHLLQGIGRSMIWAGMGITFGLTFAIGMAFMAPAALAFTSALKPANKGLQKASMVTGSVFSGALFIAGLATIVAGVGVAAGLIGSTEGGLLVFGGGSDIFDTTTIPARLLQTADEAAVADGEEAVADSAMSGSKVANGTSATESFASVYEHKEMVASDESAAVSNTGPVVENIPKFTKAVFGCGDNGELGCNHDDVYTFSALEHDEPKSMLYPGESVESVTNRVGGNSFDEIFQEYVRNDYLQLGYALLRPGGRMYVIVTDMDNGGPRWLLNYGEQAGKVFGDDNVDVVEGLDDIKKIADNFGVRVSDEYTCEVMLVFKKAG